MEREFMKQLLLWKNNPRRKPLMIKGARQVGKTWLMKEFGRQYYQKVAYVNFDNNSRMKQVFAQDFDLSRILLAINAETGVRVTPKDTLLIFDEVQEAPMAISSLKYFCENAPEYHVIAAGSQLGTAIHQGVSFPVGKVNTLHLYPLSFFEFLKACGEDGLAGLLKQKDPILLSSFHDRFVTCLKNYYFVGGMPEVVSVFAEQQDFTAVRRLQQELLEMYEADFGKHIPEKDLMRVRMIWNAIPMQLAKENKKFFFGQVKKGGRAKEFELGTQWLLDCGLISKVNRVTKPAIPLKAYQEQNVYKLFFLDIGLLSASSGLDAKVLLEGSRVFTEFKGALTEQYVCQQLLSDTPYQPYYFTSENGRYEIDFMIQQGDEPMPLEVKAEQNVHARSLRAYYDKYQPSKTIRLSMNDYRLQDWVENIPLFAIHAFLHEGGIFL